MSSTARNWCLLAGICLPFATACIANGTRQATLTGAESTHAAPAAAQQLFTCAPTQEAMSLVYETGDATTLPSQAVAVPVQSLDFALRLDLCTDLSQDPAVLTVKQAVYALNLASVGRISGSVEGDQLRVAHLVDAVFAGDDLAAFSLEMPLPQNRLLKLRGVNGSDPSKNYIAGEVDQGNIKIFPSADGKIFGGFLNQGDPFSECQVGMIPQHRFIQAGTARIGFNWCFGGFSTSGGYPGYLNELSVIDRNDQLGANKGKLFTIKKEEFRRLVDLKMHHHNICDSLQISLPHASYQVTAGPAGAGSQENYDEDCTQPDRVFVANPKPSDGRPWMTVYHVQYADPMIPAQTGGSNAPHFVKGNPNQE